MLPGERRLENEGEEEGREGEKMMRGKEKWGRRGERR